MNWDAISAIGSLLGAVAVGATLLYLALEVKHARKEVQRSISQARAQTVRDLLMFRATNDNLANHYVKATLAIAGSPPSFVSAVAEKTGLKIEEASELYWEQLAWWQYRLEVIPYVHELSESAREEFEAGILQNYGRQPIEKLFYESAKPNLPAEAVRYIDEILARST